MIFIKSLPMFRYKNSLPPGKDPWPLVCTECGGLNWVHAISNDGKEAHDYCLICEKIVKVDWITPELWKKTTGKDVTQEYLELKFEKP